MLGDKLDNFTAACKADVSEPPPKPACTEEIWAALGEIPDLGEEDLLEISDILVQMIKHSSPLWHCMKKWVLKQVKTST